MKRWTWLPLTAACLLMNGLTARASLGPKSTVEVTSTVDSASTWDGIFVHAERPTATQHQFEENENGSTLLGQPAIMWRKSGGRPAHGQMLEDQIESWQIDFEDDLLASVEDSTQRQEVRVPRGLHLDVLQTRNGPLYNVVCDWEDAHHEPILWRPAWLYPDVTIGDSVFNVLKFWDCDNGSLWSRCRSTPQLVVDTLIIRERKTITKILYIRVWEKKIVRKHLVPPFELGISMNPMISGWIEAHDQILPDIKPPARNWQHNWYSQDRASAEIPLSGPLALDLIAFGRPLERTDTHHSEVWGFGAGLSYNPRNAYVWTEFDRQLDRRDPYYFSYAQAVNPLLPPLPDRVEEWSNRLELGGYWNPLGDQHYVIAGDVVHNFNDNLRRFDTSWEVDHHRLVLRAGTRWVHTWAQTLYYDTATLHVDDNIHQQYEGRVGFLALREHKGLLALPDVELAAGWMRWITSVADQAGNEYYRFDQNGPTGAAVLRKHFANGHITGLVLGQYVHFNRDDTHAEITTENRWWVRAALAVNIPGWRVVR